jgi:hypothetical protein
VEHCTSNLCYMAKSKLLHVRVEPRHEAMLATYPSERDLTVSELVRAVIEEWFEARQRSAALARPGGE